MKISQLPNLADLPFKETIFLFQGGGALGSYQGGVYEAFHQACIRPTWVCGISIGAINAAIIAGNDIDSRKQKLKEFWNLITQDSCFGDYVKDSSDYVHSAFNMASATQAAMFGAPHFFRPRPLPTLFYPQGTLGATSLYDTAPLETTLEKLIDFDRINHKESIRLSLGAVNARTGNFVYFDNKERVITSKHIMASGALPPAFPFVEIDGEMYWDGGLVSNTPLEYVVEKNQSGPNLVVQVDLWESSSASVPRDIMGVMTRQKEIQYASRTRKAVSDLRRRREKNTELRKFLDFLPQEYRETPKVKKIMNMCRAKIYNIVLLIYRSQGYELHSKDYNFSHLSMKERWEAGYNGAARAVNHTEAFNVPAEEGEINIYDFGNEED